jgi:hypothetical protein
MSEMMNITMLKIMRDKIFRKYPQKPTIQILIDFVLIKLAEAVVGIRKRGKYK